MVHIDDKAVDEILLRRDRAQHELRNGYKLLPEHEQSGYVRGQLVILERERRQLGYLARKLYEPGK